MPRDAGARITAIWAFASLLTVASWLLGVERGDGRVAASAPITVAVITIGFVKAFCITEQFMEVREAPRWLQRLTAGWLVVLWAGILAIYLY